MTRPPSSRLAIAACLYILGGACHDGGEDRPGLEAIEADCQLSGTKGGIALSPDGTLSVSKRCATTIGGAFGIDWESFSEEPHHFDTIETPAEVVIGGLITSLGTNSVSVGETLSNGVPSSLAQRLLTLQEDSDLGNDDDSGEVWFHFLYEAIQAIEYAPSRDAVMGYRGGVVYVGDVTDAYPPSNSGSDTGGGLIWIAGPPISAIESAMCLVHEASHLFYGDHGSCEDELTGDEYGTSCDATENGAYGAGVWWGYLWMMANYYTLEYATCDAGLEAVEDHCEHINGAAEWVACTTRIPCTELL